MSDVGVMAEALADSLSLSLSLSLSVALRLPASGQNGTAKSESRGPTAGPVSCAEEVKPRAGYSHSADVSPSGFPPGHLAGETDPCRPRFDPCHP